jgi:hypothetical protein
MRVPNRFERPPASIRRSQRIIRKAKSIPAIAGPIPAFEAAVTLLSDAYNAWMTARTNWLIAIGDQREARTALDEQIRGVGLAILTVDRGRRSSEIYRKYFPGSYGTVLCKNVAKALETASSLLGVLGEETRPEILGRREPLTNAITQLQSATANRQVAIATLGEAKGQLEEQKLAWRKAYSWFYFEVRNILSDQRSLVEDLFRSPRGTAGDEEGSEDGQSDVAASKAA